MPTEDSKANNDAQIREVIGSWAKAVRAKDVEGAMACLTPDILTFDLAPPLQHEGLEVIRKSLEEWLPTWDGPIGLEIRDLRVTADRDVAFCTSLQRMSGTKTDGEKPDLWFRSTMCLQKIDGTWRIAHEHTSTPFYMDGSNKAALDLKP
ncbi:MAG: YybH family protein [Gammaproteobacteria bacterium]